MDPMQPGTDRVQPSSRRVVIVSGAPGAGKTTLARALADMLGWPLLAKDAIKEAIWDALGPPEGDLGWSRLVGGAAMEALWTLAASPCDVVVEANFRPDSQREQARLRALEGRVVEVHCSCPPEEAARRYAERARDPAHHRAHVLATVGSEFLAEFGRPMAAGPVIVVDTSAPIDVPDLARRVTEALDRAGDQGKTAQLPI